jgi:hypothetical protein
MRYSELEPPLPENNAIRDQRWKRVFIFAEAEGAYREVWMDPDGSAYREARETGTVDDNPWKMSQVRRKVNWIASAVILEDYDFTLQAPRETA